MGHFPGAVRDSLANHDGIADVRIAGNYATSTGSMPSRLPRITPASLIDSPKSAVHFVENRVAEGADYIKIVADVPGPSQDVINTLVDEAHKHGKLTVAHAARIKAFAMAQEGKVDVITHIPVDFALDKAAAKLMRDEGGCVFQP
jgi:imidazolonepropionase-like amidohydrolase